MAIVACSSEEGAELKQYHGQFTSVAAADCTALSTTEIEQHKLLRLGQAVFYCVGAAPYALYLVDDGTRSWYVLDRGGSQYALDEDIIYGRTAGNFPNVGITKQVEWLLDSQNIAVGLVFSVSYQMTQPSNGGFKHMQQHLAYALIDDRPVLVSQDAEGMKCRRSLVEYLASH